MMTNPQLPVEIDQKMYRNPVLFADYSDPDVIRFGDWFYMTASSFQYTPGLPILRSSNLVDWELVTYALPEIPIQRYEIPQVSCGVWAPAIRIHNGLVWIFYGMPDEGIYAISAKTPEGPWSAPSLIRKAKGFIDPCPFWDNEGNGWIIHAYAKSRIGFKSVLGCFQFMDKGKEVQGVDSLIFDGSQTQPTIEGPKVYQRTDYIYIFAPAGGVATGWQTVLRSTSIHGPFEERIVLAQGDSSVNGPHQGAWVTDAVGNDWFVHFQDRGAYGRIVHVQPLHWLEDDWPVIGEVANGATCGIPVSEYPMPTASVESSFQEESDTDDFSVMNLQWQWAANPPRNAYHLADGLVLHALNPDGNPDFSLWNKPNVLTQKLRAASCLISTELYAQNLKEGDEAGIALLGAGYLALRLVREKTWKLILSEAAFGESDSILQRRKVRKPELKLVMHIEEVDGQPLAHFGWSDGGDIEWFDLAYRPKKNTWTGVKPALFAVSKEATGGDARFANFTMHRLD